jgi:hypothetical protein
MRTAGGMPERLAWRSWPADLRLRRAVQESYAGVTLGLQRYPLGSRVFGHCARSVRSDLIYPRILRWNRTTRRVGGVTPWPFNTAALM